MAQRLTRSFINTSVPGAYPNTVVKSTPVGLSATGIIAIIGEAEGGEHFSTENIKNNFFSPDQLDRVVQKYTSGPVVDAMRALSAPSADAGINGSASRIYICKTNPGQKAEATVDTDYGTLSAKNQGLGGNQIKYQVTASQFEVTPSLTGTVIPAFGAALDDAEFQIRLNGGASATVTLSNVPANHSNVATLVTELNGLLPTGITASAGVAANTIVLSVNADSVNYRKGWGKSFELVDSTPGDLAKLGLVPGLRVSAAESEVELSVVRSDAGINETLVAAGEVAMQVGYQGTTATLSITGNTLSTTVTGGSGANLSIDISQYQTVKDLADFINSKSGYSAIASTSSNQLKPSELDKVSAIGICSTAASLRPGRIKKSLSNFKAAVEQSIAVDFEAIDVDGLPSPMASAVFLSGGQKGATTGLDVVDALAKLEAVEVNFVVPLFSRDASADISDNLTDSSSTYTIDAIHAATKSHILKMSTPKLKRNRLGILSFWGSYLNAQSKAQTLANFRCSMTFQKVSQVNSEGDVVSFLPWYGACIAAGMQAAGFYKGITNKFANVVSYTDPSGFDSGSPGDVEKAIEAGMLFLQRETAGSKWVTDQTTYGFDTNFVYNSIQASYLADIAALNLADSLQRAYVGQSLADVDAASVSAFIATRMDEYRRLKIISGSDDAPVGFKNVKIEINGPVLEVSLEIKLSTTIYFIPINLSISQVSSTVEQ
jgi:hypothetical protein